MTSPRDNERGTMGANDAVKNYLEGRGCDFETVDGGLPGLVADWEGVVEDMAEEGYGFGLDDLLNDMDARDILEGALLAAGVEAGAARAATQLADDEFKSLSVPTDKCLWGESIAKKNGWTHKKQWWYFRVPAKRNEDLDEDLESAGIKAMKS